MHDNISLSSLSRSLIGLNKQALSFRKEALGKDYLHKFYEDHATQGEIKNPDEKLYEVSHNWESPNVRM